jgi:hypothetical protein
MKLVGHRKRCTCVLLSKHHLGKLLKFSSCRYLAAFNALFLNLRQITPLQRIGHSRLCKAFDLWPIYSLITVQAVIAAEQMLMRLWQKNNIGGQDNTFEDRTLFVGASELTNELASPLHVSEAEDAVASSTEAALREDRQIPTRVAPPSPDEAESLHPISDQGPQRWSWFKSGLAKWHRPSSKHLPKALQAAKSYSSTSLAGVAGALPPKLAAVAGLNVSVRKGQKVRSSTCNSCF